MNAVGLMTAMVLMALTLLVPAQAGMRSLDPIQRAEDAPASLLPVPVEAVEGFVHDVAAAWNRQQLEPFLAPDFPNRAQVLAGFPGEVLPGTRLRILSIGPVRTIEQERVGTQLISVVMARVRVQVETPRAEGGFHQQTAFQELVIRVVREVPG